MSEENTNSYLEGLVTKNTPEDNIYTMLATHTGCGIVTAIKLYKQFLKDTGRVLSSEDRKAKILQLVTEAAGPEKQVKDLEALVKSVEESTGLSAQAAHSNIKKVCTAAGFALPEKVEALGDVNTWLVTHPNATRDEFMKWIESTDRKKSTGAAYWNSFLFAKRCYVAWTS